MATYDARNGQKRSERPSIGHHFARNERFQWLTICLLCEYDSWRGETSPTPATARIWRTSGRIPAGVNGSSSLALPAVLAFKDSPQASTAVFRFTSFQAAGFECGKMRQGISISTTACALMASSRPSGPRRSLVLALIETRLGLMPRVAARRVRMASM